MRLIITLLVGLLALVWVVGGFAKQHKRKRH
jgi:hypothetical protein